MSALFGLAEVEAALPVVRAVMPPTPQYAWPQLAAATGAEVVVKHENHTPTGAFKVRGGLVYVDRLKRARPARRRASSARRAAITASRSRFAGAPRRACASSSWCRTAIPSRRTRRCAASAPN